MQPLAQKVKSKIKDTNQFLNKIKKIGKLPEGAIISTMDLVCVYPNIPHGEGFVSLCSLSETWDNKQISSDTLAQLTGIILNNDIFVFEEKTFKQFKQKGGTIIRTKFVSTHAILLMVGLEKKMLETFKGNSMICYLK